MPTPWYSDKSHGSFSEVVKVARVNGLQQQQVPLDESWVVKSSLPPLWICSLPSLVTVNRPLLIVVVILFAGFDFRRLVDPAENQLVVVVVMSIPERRGGHCSEVGPFPLMRA